MKIFISSALLGSHEMRERKAWSSTSARSDCRFLALFKRRRKARKRYDSRSRTEPSSAFFAVRARDTVAANLLEEAAATVSRALTAKKADEGYVPDLESYLFRAFLRRLTRSKKRQWLLAEHRAED